MLQKIYKVKNLEEVLGALGIAYLLVIGVLTVSLVNLLVSSVAVALRERSAPHSEVPRFELEMVKEAIRS